MYSGEKRCSIKEKKSLNVHSLFSVVEIEVNSRCNLKCNYCPSSILPMDGIPEYMRVEVFSRLLDELARIGFSGRLSYHFYNEPLLRHDLEMLVSQVSDRLPKAYQLLFTNGVLLTNKRYHSLLEAGLDYFVVTSHNNKPIPEREFQKVILPTELILTNRGGTMFTLDKSLDRPCYAPDEMLIVTCTGDVLLCFEDAKRNHIMGNIMEKSLEEIWFSSRFASIRNLLKDGKRNEASSICKNCNNTDYTEPDKTYMIITKNDLE